MILSTESEWQRSSEDIATRPVDAKTIAGDPMHGFLLTRGVLGAWVIREEFNDREY